MNRTAYLLDRFHMQRSSRLAHSLVIERRAAKVTGRTFMEPGMPGNSSSHRGKFSIGHAVGRAMAKRIIDLNHPDAMIIDNRPTIFIERRKSTETQRSENTPRRRSTDAQPASDGGSKKKPPEQSS